MLGSQLGAYLLVRGHAAAVPVSRQFGALQLTAGLTLNTSPIVPSVFTTDLVLDLQILFLTAVTPVSGSTVCSQCVFWTEM